MEHELAVTSHAVERYFLSEMAPEEKEAFEEHFFQCESCARDVRAASEFIESSRHALGDLGLRTKPVRHWSSWLRPLFSFAPAYAALAAACMVIIGYQNLREIPALKAPQEIPSGIPLEGNTRSSVPKLRGGEAARFEMPWDRGGPAFVELRNQTHVISKGAVKAPPRNQPLDVYFPGELEPGRYSVVVHTLEAGHPGPEVFESGFDVIGNESVAR